METIKDCMDSVYNQKNVLFEIIVVDNGSTDGSIEYLKSNYPAVKIISNNNNLGYSKANNQGIAVAKGDYLLLLNSDALLTPDCMNRFLSSIKEDSQVGSVSGKVLRMNGSMNIIDSTGIILNRKKFSPADRGEGETDVGQYNNKEYIFGVSGAAAFYSRKMLENVRVNNEIFDEDFFAYYEDLDLAWRAQIFGWKCLYIPDALIYHLRKGPKAQNRMVYIHSFKNRYLCYIKNDTRSNFLEYFPFNIGYELLRCIKKFILEPYLIWSVYLSFLSLPKMLKK
ncbi:MAG: hypothetical protein A2161_05460, partial [Candidatus Schekmanbacteria bacterium RBG_13_48_7]